MSVKINLEEELVALLRQSNQSVEHTACELIVLELYRRRTISSGKAAELVGMPRLEFIQYASRLGIDYITMSEDEWQTERHLLENL